ncbi:MAG: hypothetical protein JW888_14445 [Pirellulales bacterium]|nr:hypothetical protein [Pirellulales bacterium]
MTEWIEARFPLVAGHARRTDYVLEGVVMLRGNTGNVGLVFRADNPDPDPDQMRGYYVGCNTQTLYLGNMNDYRQPLATVDLGKLDCRVVPGAWNQIRAAVAGLRIGVWFDRMHPSADKDAGSHASRNEVARS